MKFDKKNEKTRFGKEDLNIVIEYFHQYFS